VKVSLLKGDRKAVFGKDETSFDYYYRPLSVEEKHNVNARIVWKTENGRMTIDFKATDLAYLLRLGVTHIERFHTEDDDKIGDIEALLSLKAEPGFLDGVMIAMWVELWQAMVLPEDLKKKLSQDSTPQESESPPPPPK